MRPVALTRAGIRACLAGREPAPGRSDAATAAQLAGLPPPPVPRVLTRAAVLVPLVDRPDGFTVLLTRRTAHLHHHAGQISFPGGRLEACDGDCVQACALRETEEEIGLSADRVDVLGQLDDYVTITGFRVTPLVGAVSPPFVLAPDSFEVAEVFEVPLAFLLDPANHQRGSRMVGGVERLFHAIPHGEHFIWGATAGMMMNLFEALGGCSLGRTA